LEELHASPGNHHAVVCAEARGWERHLPSRHILLPCPSSLREFLIGSVSDVAQHRSEGLVGRHASDHYQGADGRARVVEEADGATEAVVEVGKCGGLEGGAKVAGLSLRQCLRDDESEQ
jgi:hypothetical protein